MDCEQKTSGAPSNPLEIADQPSITSQARGETFQHQVLLGNVREESLLG